MMEKESSGRTEKAGTMHTKSSVPRERAVMITKISTGTAEAVMTAAEFIVLPETEGMTAGASTGTPAGPLFPEAAVPAAENK